MEKIITFLKEVKVELSKVVWPSRKQTIRMTMAVIGISTAVAIFVGAVDYLLTKLLGLLIGG